MQELANLLWAMGTAQRANSDVFEKTATAVMKSAKEDLTTKEDSPSRLQSQEWSNSIWVFATAQIYNPAQQELLVFCADLLDKQPELRKEFKPQELSNTAWGVATLLSNKKTTTFEEEDAAVRLLRH